MFLSDWAEVLLTYRAGKGFQTACAVLEVSRAGRAAWFALLAVQHVKSVGGNVLDGGGSGVQLLCQVM
jgi:hypothetical protein